MHTGFLRHDVWCVEAGEMRLVWRLLAHFPKEPAFWIGIVRCNIEGTFGGVQPSDHIQAWLVDGAFGLFGVLQGYTNLDIIDTIRCRFMPDEIVWIIPGNLALDVHPS